MQGPDPALPLSAEMKAWLARNHYGVVAADNFICHAIKDYTQWVSYYSVRSGRAPPAELNFNFCFTDEQMLSAHAVKLAPASFGIAISESGVAILHDMFRRMLSHPECFPDIGNAAGESVAEATVNHLTRDVTLYWEGIAVTHLQVHPRCPVRRNYASALTTFAGVAISLHELGHALQGHHELPRDDLTPMDWRALETGADMFSAIWLWQVELSAVREPLRPGQGRFLGWRAAHRALHRPRQVGLERAQGGWSRCRKQAVRSA